MDRRTVLLGLAATVAAPSLARAQFHRSLDRVPDPTIDEPEPGQMGNQYELQSAPTELPYQFRRQPVAYRSQEAPGTVIIDTSDRFLYVIQGNNRAMRYGIGVGRDGFTWQGILRVTRKAEWPDWRRRPR